MEAYAEATIVKDINLPRNLVNSSAEFNQIIKLSYELKVEAKIFGLHSNLVLFIPITIGSVPLVVDEMTENYVANNESTIELG